MKIAKTSSLLLLSACACAAAAASSQDAAGSSAASPLATVGFKCAEGQDAAGCAVGEAQLSLDIFDQGAGEVGLRLRNRGAARSLVSEVYLLDEAGLLRPETLALRTEGLVHFRQSKKARPFPLAPGDEEAKAKPVHADVALRRRAEVTRIGRFLRTNGVNNGEEDALTLVMKTTNEALDAELVADASSECLLRLAVVMTGFEADPKATRTFHSSCAGAK